MRRRYPSPAPGAVLVRVRISRGQARGAAGVLGAAAVKNASRWGPRVLLVGAGDSRARPGWCRAFSGRLADFRTRKYIRCTFGSKSRRSSRRTGAPQFRGADWAPLVTPPGGFAGVRPGHPTAGILDCARGLDKHGRVARSGDFYDQDAESTDAGA